MGRASKANERKVLAIDVGGSKVKMLLSGEQTPRKFPSGPTLTPDQMVAGVLAAVTDWKYDVISIGFPAPVHAGQPVDEPVNLGKGWVGFDFRAAFGCPVRMINDAAMQALGSYEGDKMLFLGLGTGLGSAMVINGLLQPMELGHLPYRKRTYEDYVGTEGLRRLGKKKWTHCVFEVVELFRSALLPDYIVIGGGNVRALKELPEGCRAGSNAHAFIGGFRLWEEGDPTRAQCEQPAVTSVPGEVL